MAIFHQLTHALVSIYLYDCALESSREDGIATCLRIRLAVCRGPLVLDGARLYDLVGQFEERSSGRWNSKRISARQSRTFGGNNNANRFTSEPILSG